jgi:hypothetical protein
VVAPSDGVINALPVIRKVSEHGAYALTSIDYAPTVAGETFIRLMKEMYPDALIVGSIIAAQAYKGQVVAPVPLRHDRNGVPSRGRLNRSNCFATFIKESTNG